MSKILDNLKQAELDRAALADAESRLVSERFGRAMAEEQRVLEQEAERKARERAVAEARALEAAQARLEAERDAQRAAQARMQAAAEAGRIERERLVTELELKRAAQARTEEEANEALASLDSDVPFGGPLPRRARRAPPRKGPLALAWTLLVLALLAVLAAGIAIGRYAFTRPPSATPASARGHAAGKQVSRRGVTLYERRAGLSIARLYCARDWTCSTRSASRRCGWSPARCCDRRRGAQRPAAGRLVGWSASFTYLAMQRYWNVLERARRKIRKT
jgi:hypothetical protein